MNTKFHPLCDSFPDMEDDAFTALCESIETSGLREPIVAIGNQILDGKHRFKACKALNINPTIRQFDPVKDGASPAQFVFDRNFHRRHLTASQKSVIGVQLMEEIKADRERQREANESKAEPGRSREIAAKTVGVSTTTIGKAAKLKKDDPTKFAQVKSGKLTLNEAVAEVQDPQRDYQIEQISVSHGDEVAGHVRSGSILIGKELSEFVGLPVDDQGKVLPLVKAGWKPRVAARFIRGIFGGDDTIQDLCNYVDWKGESVSVNFDNHRITLEPCMEEED